MTRTQFGHAPNKEAFCSACRRKIKAGGSYHHNSKILCEDCYIHIRTSRVRKTHWQYLRSIKTEYLIPGKATQKGQ